MLSLFSAIVSFKGKEKDTHLDPKTFLAKLGSTCTSCNKKITYSSSISICDCNQYGHIQCVKKHLDTLKLTQNDTVTCLACQKSIQLTFEKQLKLGMNVKLQNSLIIVMLCIAIAFLLSLIKQQYHLRPSDRDLIVLSFQMFLVIVLFIALLVLAFLSVIYRESKVKDIKRTKNQVIASAFEGILTHRDQDISSNVIFT